MRLPPAQLNWLVPESVDWPPVMVSVFWSVMVTLLLPWANPPKTETLQLTLATVPGWKVALSCADCAPG
jgi:hypothetical protein